MTRLQRILAAVRRNPIAVITAGLVATYAAILAFALAVSVWALIALALAGIGCAIAIVLPAYISSAQAVRHSRDPRRRIEAGTARRQIDAAERKKELTP